MPERQEELRSHGFDRKADERTIQRRRPRREQPKKHTPFLLKFLSWLGVILICFVAGYLGTEFLMKMLDNKSLLKSENRYETQEDVDKLKAAEQNRASGGDAVRQLNLIIYYANGEDISNEEHSFTARTQEDNIKDALDKVFSLSQLPNADLIELKHIFRNGDTVFLDLSPQFVTTLNDIGEKRSMYLLTSIVRTIQDNFPPIVQARFLIDSKTPSSGGTVDLTRIWKMPSARS